MLTIKQQIKEYVDDHYRYFAFYPYDVEVENKVYSYQQYMEILGYKVKTNHLIRLMWVSNQLYYCHIATW